MEMNRQVGELLLELQDLDLAIARDQRELSTLPELVELAKKRKGLQKLKAEATKLYARRKDAQTELGELEEQEQAVLAAVEAAQTRMNGLTDYREVQDIELQLSDLAKRLDKISYARAGAQTTLETLLAQEEKLDAYSQRYEAAMRQDAQTAREKAGALQGAIEANTQAREQVAGRLPAAGLQAYEQASKRFKGLAVEYLDGSVPSICRTALSSASLAEVRRKGALATCPYCHRIIVTTPREES